jgi:hypothetical protein
VGIKTALFGGEGLFFASVRDRAASGFQTLPFLRVADRNDAARKVIARTSSAIVPARSARPAI